MGTPKRAFIAESPLAPDRRGWQRPLPLEWICTLVRLPRGLAERTAASGHARGVGDPALRLCSERLALRWSALGRAMTRSVPLGLTRGEAHHLYMLPRGNLFWPLSRLLSELLGIACLFAFLSSRSREQYENKCSELQENQAFTHITKYDTAASQAQ